MARPIATLALALWATVGLVYPVAAADDTPVLFVCEHGSVKSLMAVSLFNATATRRGLPFRGIARGVTPDASVPAPIANALNQEGFDVRQFKPTAVSKSDAEHAAHIVAIGVDLSKVTHARTEHWDDVPAASVDYSAAHAALQRHIDTLLDRLSQTAPAK
jgi:arsenate reductase